MITIRSARLEDYTEYYKLYKACFRSTLVHDEPYYKSIIESGNRFLYFAEENGLIVGMIYCFYMEHPELKTTVEIQNMCVYKEHRKRGIATMLMKHLLIRHRKCCNWFEIIDHSGGITGRIVEGLGFESIKNSRLTYRVPAWILTRKIL